MKKAVFLLVLANLLFFAYAQGYFGRPDNPDAIRLQKQMNPAQIQIVSRGEPPAAKEGEKKGEAESKPAAPEKPAETAKAAPGSEICLAWAGLSAADADRLAVLLTEKFEGFKLNRQAVGGEASSWWVFIPPLASKAEADKKASELKKLGVEDFQIIQDSGPNHWAISLGVFSSEAGAQKRLAQLKDKGVKSAKQNARNGKEASYTIEARGPAASQQALLDTTAAISSMKLEAKACQ